MALLSWFKKGEKFDSYACSGERPDQIQKMRDEGYISMEERLAQILAERHSVKQPPA